jgi:hypothetical protein
MWAPEQKQNPSNRLSRSMSTEAETRRDRTGNEVLKEAGIQNLLVRENIKIGLAMLKRIGRARKPRRAL